MNKKKTVLAADILLFLFDTTFSISTLISDIVAYRLD